MTMAGLQIADPDDPDVKPALDMYFSHTPARNAQDLNSVIIGGDGSLFLIWKNNSWTVVTPETLQAAIAKKVGNELLEMAAALERGQKLTQEFLPQTLEVQADVQAQVTAVTSSLASKPLPVTPKGP